ncbi:MAG: alginate lyase family protein [Pyrinomonadaceae bacterium]
MTIARRINHAFRGQVSARAALSEIGRRGFVALRSRYERWTQSFEKAGLARVRLSREFANIPTPELLEHFRSRCTPRFFSGFELAPNKLSELHSTEFPEETRTLMDKARGIVTAHRWPLLGYGELSFGKDIEWLRDPVSGAPWPPDRRADVALANGAGSDVRVLWELNRMGHLITLGRAYAVTGDKGFAEEFFVQVEGWRDQNRPGFGPNWTCAMEVALRAMNLLAAFQLLRGATNLTEERLALMLTLFEQHGHYIRRHLEFSYIATSNHYLSDVVGLLWLGICLPELEQADEWRAFGFREILREMDKQVLPDGAHYESSTGYHRFVLELLLYTFILCRANNIEIGNEYWQKLRSMIEYLRAYLRPDGPAPLIGDTDSGQVMPIASHTAADHAYLLDVAATVFSEAGFKTGDESPEELFWLLGEAGLEIFRGLSAEAGATRSAGFSEAGTFILRDRDSYLLLNASGTGLLGRGAHGHNDALSLEVAACGTSFISDPGTCVYTGDLALRHQFRSTGYHSTVEVDGREQNTTEEGIPFYIGNEASPRQLQWETSDQRDLVIAEHYGYENLPNGPITHRRAILFEKMERYWLIEDTLSGSGRHTFRFCFHTAPGLEVLRKTDRLTEIRDNENNSRLLVASLHLKEDLVSGLDLDAPTAELDLNKRPAVELNLKKEPVLEPRWFSRDYGQKTPSIGLCWTVEADAPLRARWLLIPVCAGEDAGTRLAVVEHLRLATISDLRLEISDLRSEKLNAKTKDQD